MKNKKMLMRIGGIILILIAGILLTHRSFGVTGTIVSGMAIVGLLIELAQVFCVALGLVGQGIISAITGMAPGDNSAIFSVKEIIFNRSTVTTASFFYNKNGFHMGLNMPWNSETIDFSQGTVSQIFDKVTSCYYIIRNLSIAALLFILLYIGIRWQYQQLHQMKPI